MDQQLLPELRQQLLAKRQMIIEQLEGIGSPAAGKDNFDAKFPDYGDSMEDSAVEVADYTKNLSLERDLEKELQGVDKAIKSMDDGTYGVCSYCGNEIELERLKIRPESTSCVACKNALKNS